MPKGNNIQVALCIIAMVVSIPGARAQLASNNTAMPSGDVWPDGIIWPPLPMREMGSGTADEPDPRSGTGLWPDNEDTLERRIPSPQIKLDITLTMRRTHARPGRHRSHRLCR